MASMASTSPTMADGSSTMGAERSTFCRMWSTPCRDGRRSSSTADSAAAPTSSRALRSAPMPCRSDGSISMDLPPPGRQACTAYWSCWRRKSGSGSACSASRASPSSTSPASRPSRRSMRPTSSARFRCWRSPNSCEEDIESHRDGPARRSPSRRLHGGAGSEPVLPLENIIGQRRRYQHQDDRKGIAILPVKLGHVLEIHTVDRGNQRRRHQHHRRDREYLDDVVLLDIDDTQQRIQHKGDLAGEITGMVGERLNVTLHATQLRAGLLGPAHAVCFVGEIQQHSPY